MYYFRIVKGDAWGVIRATMRTLNETARGSICTKLARILIDGGIFLSLIENITTHPHPVRMLLIQMRGPYQYGHYLWHCQTFILIYLFLCFV